MASLPPSRGASHGSSIGTSSENNNNIATTLPTTSSSLDPESLLDALDTFTNSAANNRYSDLSTTNNTAAPSNDTQQTDTQQTHNFDPIDFLNQHYHTEQQLVTALPQLRSAISSRLTHLDDTLSTTLRHQSALAPTLERDVQHAKLAVQQLASRIAQVQSQAQRSEVAVLEITKDMKRLDYAKQHLQRTITALKRLHMLLHAAEQLRKAAMVTPQQPIPKYAQAAHLVDATRLLLGHFDGYMSSVPKMRQVRDAVGVIKGQLWEGIVKLFQEVGSQQQPNNEQITITGEDGETAAIVPVSSMVQKTLADACLVIESLGPKSKERFISDFIKDQLQEYDELYNPSPASMGKKKTSSGSASASGGSSQSFKKDSSTPNSSPNRNKNTTTNKPTSLDTVENRFTWFRNKLRSLQLNFNNVFIPEWNVHYRLTVQFLEMTARHLKFTLKKYYNKNTVRILPFKSGAAAGQGGSSSSGVAASAVSKFGSSLNKSSHGNNNSSHGNDDGVSEGEKAVTALLKALQKTILFEKEMMAWLSRDFGTKFIDPSLQENEILSGSMSMGLDAAAAADEDDDLEFDSQGRAYPAQSPEGIKIKYERRKRMGGKESSAPAVVSAGGPVASLAGLASTTFDDHMSPYVSLEERSMDEQLFNAASDNEVTRGERPVFVSSTNLFIYIKNSITRCTALTKEKTFFLLQRAFQKKLCGYASVLEKKLPQPQSAAGLSLALSKGASSQTSSASSTTYRIPSGEEVTICHVIDTCEYCADTVEALEDLIRDKIGHKYKEKIDMSEEQGAFQDVTAKSIRVLVSGLEQRLDAALKDMSKTNWSAFDMVGEESSYVRSIHLVVHPFVCKVRELIPSSYFRSFCDKFALLFISTYYKALVGLKKISEMGTQQLLLDVYSIKTLLLKLPVLEVEKKKAVAPRRDNTNLSAGSTIAPAMYTKMVNKEFRKLETLLKLVGSPKEMLVDMFRAQWDCSMDTNAMASDFTLIMTLKGIPRIEHPAMLESLGVDAGELGAQTDSAMTANIQAMQDRGADVAAKVNADLNQMRQKVDDFRKAFR